MTTYQQIALAASTLPLLLAGGAQAQTAKAAVATATETPFAAPIGEDDLGKVAGREDTGAMIASATQRNTVANNSVTGTSTTGNVRIDGNAFQNLQGLAVISANSGNNVAMNSAMNVTVNIAPR